MGTATRNAMLDAIETAVGTAPILTLRTGAAPANCGTANSGTVIATMTLPSDWLAAAASGAKALSGTWSDASADNSGTVGHYRIHDSAGTVCHLQGTVTITGGGGDMTLNAVVVTATQVVSVTSYTITAANA
jgi:hypothetical protein